MVISQYHITSKFQSLGSVPDSLPSEFTALNIYAASHKQPTVDFSKCNSSLLAAQAMYTVYNKSTDPLLRRGFRGYQQAIFDPWGPERIKSRYKIRTKKAENAGPSLCSIMTF